MRLVNEFSDVITELKFFNNNYFYNFDLLGI